MEVISWASQRAVDGSKRRLFRQMVPVCPKGEMGLPMGPYDHRHTVIESASIRAYRREGVRILAGILELRKYP